MNEQEPLQSSVAQQSQEMPSQTPISGGSASQQQAPLSTPPVSPKSKGSLLIKIGIVLLVLLLIGGVVYGLQYLRSKPQEEEQTPTTVRQPSIPMLEEDPFPEDQDRDGLSKTEEDALGTNDLEFDTDGDGVGDYEEVHQYKTDPNAVDTDNDGFPDGLEIARGFDPLSSSEENNQ